MTKIKSIEMLNTLYPYVSKEMQVAISEAIESNGRRIPKAVKLFHGYKHYCPGCGHTNINLNGFLCKNCPDCGQLLDWSEDND